MEAVIKIGKETVIYAIGTAIKKLFGFLLLPIYTMVLSPAEYGIYESIDVALAFIFVLLNFGIDNAKNRFFYDTTNEQTKGKILFMVLVFRTFTLIPILLIIISSGWIAEKFFTNYAAINIIIIAAISIFTGFLFDEAGSLFRLYREPWKYNIFIILRALLLFGLGILFVLILKWGIAGALLANAISEGLIGGIFIIVFKRRYKIGFDKTIIKNMLKYGLPYMGSGIIFWLLSLSNRYILLYFESFDAVGIYSIANLLSQPLDLLNIAITLSFFPAIISHFEKEENPNKTQTKLFIQKVIHLYIFFALIIIAGLSIFSKELVLIITNTQYYESASLIPVILFGSCFFQIALLIMIVFDITKKTKWVLVIAAINALINILLNSFFIYKFGIIGAPIANMITYFFYLLCTIWLQNKIFVLPLYYIKLLLLILSGFSFIFVISYFNDYLLMKNLLFKSLVLLIFCFIILSFKIVTLIEIKSYFAMILKRKKNG